MRNVWLIDALAFPFVEQAEALHAAGKTPPVGTSAAGDLPLTVRGATAFIDVAGPLVPFDEDALWLRYLFGQATSYQGLREAIRKADGDDSVKKLEFRIDSPGGTVAGLFQTLELLGDVSKPKQTKATLAASAAYAIAANAGKITALGQDATFGSIGVAASYYVSDRVVDVTNSASKAKRPDIRTEEGRSVVRSYLDEIYELFADAIATGRGTTAERVNESFGGGRIFLAANSLLRGLVDEVADYIEGEVPSSEMEAAELALRKMGRAQRPKPSTAGRGDIGDQVAERMLGARAS